MSQPGFEARRLLREARVGVLATVAGGEPAQGLVTPATDPALGIILLLSGLSAHTAALERDGRCALLVTGAPAGANPQLTPRISVNGRAEKLARDHPALPAMRARYLAVHPYASLYVDFDDFSFWRIEPEVALHVAGFGRARTLSRVSLCPEPARVAAIAAAAAPPAGVVGVDLDGFDVTAGEATVRRSFEREATNAADWVALARGSAPGPRQEAAPPGPGVT